MSYRQGTIWVYSTALGTNMGLVTTLTMVKVVSDATSFLLLQFTAQDVEFPAL